MHGAPHRLRCEYLDDPLGIDVTKPRLSWCVGDTRPAEVQTAYELLAASHPDLLAVNEGDLWDSGRVEGRETSQIEYQGKPLISGRSVWWKVRSYDSDGLPSPWSEAAFFEAGLLEPDDWQGYWLSAGLQGSRIATVPVPLFGREFELPAPVRQARLYLAALGQVAVQLNGERLGSAELAPNWVDYQKRVEYLTFDVGRKLQAGSNGLAVLLADGWYAGDPGTGVRQQYGDRPSFIAQLNVVLDDGRELKLATDSAWRWQPSWLLSSDPVQGENVDGTRARRNWLAGAGALDWYPVTEGNRADRSSILMTAASPVTERSSSLVEPVRESWSAAECAKLFEFPRPLFGRVRISVIAPDGGAIRIRYGLALDPAGRLCPVAEDACVAVGDEQGEPFEALFSLHGFRYVEVSGDVYREDAVSVRAIPIAQPLSSGATLITDHPRLNGLQDLMIDQLRGNQQSVAMAGRLPGDRLGNVAAFGSAAGALLTTLDSSALVSRWLRDMVDAQFPEGGFPTVVPSPPGEDALCAEGPAGSSATFVEVLWQLYRHCGDRRLLRQHFPAVKQLLAGSLELSRDFIREDLDAQRHYPADLAATAWFYRSARLAARIAGVLGNLSELEDNEELAGNVRNAFRRRFVTPDGRVVGDTPAVYALTLNFGLLDRAEQRQARRSLIESVEASLISGSPEAGELLRTPMLLRTLSEHGRPDLAYRLVLEKPFVPDPAAGGRDVGELISAGVLEWLFGALSGFAPSRDLSERHNAFRHMVIQPRPPLGIGFAEQAGQTPFGGEPPVREVEAELSTINGRFESSWQITDQAFEIRVRVPGNCSAVVVLPDATAYEVGAGSHEFNMQFGEAGDGIPVLREVS